MDFLKVDDRSTWLLTHFYSKVWTWEGRKIFLEVAPTCVGHLEGAPGSGLYNAPTRVVIRPTNHFYYRKSDENIIFSVFRWIFWSLSMGQTWVLAQFLRVFWLQRTVKIFLEVVQTCPRYLEGAARSELSNAPIPVVIRPTSHFLSWVRVNPPTWLPVLETTSLNFIWVKPRWA